MHFDLCFFALLLALHFARVTFFSWDTHSFALNFKFWKKKDNLFLSNPSMLDTWAPYIPQLTLYGINSTAPNNIFQGFPLKTVRFHSKIFKDYAVSWPTDEPVRNAGALSMNYGILLHSNFNTRTAQQHFHSKFYLLETTWNKEFCQLKDKNAHKEVSQLVSYFDPILIMSH